ncbi:MAG TPA: transglycosylase family protein [Solirubrobacterales bacterium]|nr:transglycosylase family protein [Solirubrobacterales bacterium]
MKSISNSRHALALTGAALTAALALAVGAAPAPAQDVTALESRIAGAQSEAEGLAADIEAKTAELAATRAQAAVAAEREAQVSGVLAQGRERAAVLAERVNEAEARLAEARDRLRAAIDVLERRLVSIYKGEDPDTLTLILDADGFEDLATRAEYLDRIGDADQDLVERVRALRAQVASELAAVTEARAQQEAFNERLEQARSQIAAVRADAEAQATALADARGAQAHALATLRSQVDDWTAQVQEAQSVPQAQAQEQVGDWVGDWAIPQAIVICESGGSFDAVNPSSGAGGAYQILPSTWETYGGQGQPQNASPKDQHDIAAQIWADSGGSAWVCAG